MGKIRFTIPIITASLLMGCSDFDKEQEVLLDYKEDNGSFVKLSTGEDAVEEAAENFYHLSSILSEEDKVKELLLIEELGGFGAYYDFIDNSNAVTVSDMYEKYGLAAELTDSVDSEKKKI